MPHFALCEATASNASLICAANGGAGSTSAGSSNRTRNDSFVRHLRQFNDTGPRYLKANTTILDSALVNYPQ